jgi:predicted CopG family antitoxin
MKNIAISEGVYQRLRALKKTGESFADLIENDHSRGVIEPSGLLSRSEAAKVMEAIEEAREDSSRRVSRIAEELD